ncbi:hypothetical protein BDQ17DRAFT_1312515 [Cyathus striatus]|nr:hypothetical protein BDQ17DRAFT_1312515 [Cyathus striatus]
MMGAVWGFFVFTTFLPIALGALTPATLVSLIISGFQGGILIPESPGFINATLAWSLNFNEHPVLALQPHSVNDVSLAVKWLNKYSIDFAVRSGGVADGQSDGVIIDMSKLNKIAYNSKTGVVNIGPGNVWGDVYNSLASQPVTVLGGRVPIVGVGGFSLGGGLSYLNNRHGLMIDSIVDAQVVLADGTVKWASTDADLMFGIKGAGFSMGAVTELAVKAFPKPTSIFSGFLIFPMTQFSTIMANFVATTNNNTNPDVSLLLATLELSGQPVVLVFPIVFGTEAAAKAALPWVWQLQGAIMDTSASVSWETLQTLQMAFISHPDPTTVYQLHSVVVNKMTPEIVQAAVDWQTSVEKDPRYDVLVFFETYIPGAFSSHATSSAWPHSSNTMHVIQLNIQQANATTKDATANAATLRAGAKLIETAAGSSSVLPRYPNYSLQGTAASEFYGSNLAKLKTIKKKFDPSNIFDTKINILQ